MGKGTARRGTTFGNSRYRKFFAADPLIHREFALGITPKRRIPSMDIFVFASKISLVQWGPCPPLITHINSFRISKLQNLLGYNSISFAGRVSLMDQKWKLYSVLRACKMWRILKTTPSLLAFIPYFSELANIRNQHWPMNINSRHAQLTDFWKRVFVLPTFLPVKCIMRRIKKDIPD